MSKFRTASKYTVASLSTVILGAAAYNALLQENVERPPMDRAAVKKTAIACGGVAAILWFCTIA